MKNIITAITIIAFAPLIFSGCATMPRLSLEQIKQQDVFGARHLEVPFVKQKRHWCGPAALSSILNYWGEMITQDEIAADLYLPTLKGVLNFELERYAVKKDLWAEAYSGTWEKLKEKIAGGVPVMVLISQGRVISQKNHYLVVTGFSEQFNAVIAHSGLEKDVIMDKDRFLAGWQEMNQWMLVIVPVELADWTLPSKEEYLKLGLLAEKQFKLDFALASYGRALKMARDYYLTYFNIGNVYFKMKDFNLARQYYIKAAELNTGYADAYNNLACVYLETKEYELAKSNVAKALGMSTDPEHKVCYLDTLGIIYLNQGNVSEAIVTLKQAEELISPLLPKNAASQIYHHLAQAYLRAGLGREADEMLEKAKGLE